MKIYSHKVKVNDSLENIEKRLLEKLKENGFGLVTKFSLSEIFKNKLGKNIEYYTILGVCNPNYSYKLYKLDSMLGGILPCKIVIFTENNENYVGLIKPTIQNGFTENDTLNNILSEVENILIHTIKNI